MSRFRGGFLVCAAVLALGSTARADDPCPVVNIDAKTRNIAAYPGGEPGRYKQDYAYIGAILSADAQCVTDDDDRVIAQVTVTYALEAGPLYRGSAEVTVGATVSGGVTAEGASMAVTATKKSAPGTGGGPLTVTDTIANVVVGDEDAVEDGVYAITVGFAGAK